MDSSWCRWVCNEATSALSFCNFILMPDCKVQLLWRNSWHKEAPVVHTNVYCVWKSVLTSWGFYTSAGHIELCSREKCMIWMLIWEIMFIPQARKLSYWITMRWNSILFILFVLTYLGIFFFSELVRVYAVTKDWVLIIFDCSHHLIANWQEAVGLVLMNTINTAALSIQKWLVLPCLPQNYNWLYLW